jgi:hypothetical protein
MKVASLPSFAYFARRSLAALVGLIALPCSALEPAYLSEFPDPQRVLQDFRGTDRLDTLALQMAALTRLNRFVPEMAGTRYYGAGQYPTRDEQRTLDAITAVATPLEAEVDAAVGVRPRTPGTPRGAWQAKFEAHLYGDDLYQRLMAAYFSPSFRAAHIASTGATDALRERGRAQVERGARTLAGEAEPVNTPSRTREIEFGLAMLALVVLGAAPLWRRARISASAPYAFRLALKRYQVEYVSGVLANYSQRLIKRTISFHGSEDKSAPWQPRALIQRTSHAVEESFTIDGAGRSEAFTIEEVTGRFNTQVGQRVTALWITRQGRRSCLGFWSARENQEISHSVTAESLDPLFKPWRWTVFAAIALGYVIGDLAAPFEFAGLVFAFGAYFVWLGLFMLLSWRRRTVFRRDEIMPLLARVAALPG